MESLLNRYRNITVLLLVIMAQLVLLAVDAKVQGVPLIRVWAVTAVTPVARVLEGIRGGGSGFLHSYVLLHDTNAENRRLRAELDRLKLENINLKNDLNTADRARALQVFQSKTPSRTVAATVIATGAGSNSRVVFVDRGTVAGVMRGMAVVTPDGIVGKVIAAYPIASEVLLVTDPDFAAGVVSRKGVRGNMKGQGTTQCRVDYVPTDDKLEVGEIMYTSGDDRIFPRGFPAGVVKSVVPGKPFKEVMVEPLGLQRGLEDVLILVEGVHQPIPEPQQSAQSLYIGPAAPAQEGNAAAAGAAAADPSAQTPPTEADKLRMQYKAVGEAQGHNFGENPSGSKPVDFTRLGQAPAPANGVPANPAPGSAPRSGATPAATGNGTPPPSTPRQATPAPAGNGTATPPAQRPPTVAPVTPGNGSPPPPTPRQATPAPSGNGTTTPPAQRPPAATPAPTGNGTPTPPTPKPAGGQID